MFESALSVIGGIMVAAGLLGIAYAGFRSSNLRATVKDQQVLIETIKAQREELKTELAEEKSARSLLDKRLELAEAEIAQLKEIVSGRIDFSVLETSLEHHHIEVTRRNDERHEAMMLALHDIKALLEAKRVGD